MSATCADGEGVTGAGAGTTTLCSVSQTSDMPGDDGLDESYRAGESSSVRDAVEQLLDGSRRYTLIDLAEKAGTTVDFARAFWRAMGFPNVPDEGIVFRDIDVKALQVMAELIASGRIDTTTAISLLRAQSHTTDRLVLWQTEALVDGAARMYELDDPSARMVILDRLPEMVDVLQSQLTYSWRRQLAALMVRTEDEVASVRSTPEAGGPMPLTRAVGFVDMVAYTRRSAELGIKALADLVQTFEYTSRDVITTHGARVVKTIGDAVLYVADDMATGAEVAAELLSALQAEEEMLPVRSSVVWGGVLSRNGDIFGSTVNLASRLTDVAPPGAILTDSASAKTLSEHPAAAGRYTMVPRAAAELQGLGEITPIELRRVPR
ncbi:adenylate cyclase [Bogoriella caseilytica]|uniref:Adenylate cyclase n=1 Tax=Bogoriella caseilytica TaxID=56055 RepID=A0A3N2BA48_9MICO|nr:adenylate cyclase [Bogoriella caseilytica]